MVDNDLVSKIKTSSAFRQFCDERKLASAFINGGWVAHHGAFYQDPITSKSREIDLLASQVWRANHGSRDGWVRLTVMGEAKSMVGFHLLLSSVAENTESESRMCLWVGELWQSPAIFGQVLSVCSVADDDDKREAREAFLRFCYPGEDVARVSPYLLKPPKLPLVSAFRETNVASEKDLDASVFWRAVQALQSCVLSVSTDTKHRYLELTQLAHETAVADRVDELGAVLNEAKDCACQVDILHPFVVTDAKLWVLDDGELREIPSARFVRRELNSHSGFWCDVVTREHLANYVDSLSLHYQSALSAAGAKRHR